MLKPGIFPLDASIFTGEISRKRVEEEHVLEYRQLMEKQAPAKEQILNLTVPIDEKVEVDQKVEYFGKEGE
jgi:hypothetical protein